MNHSFSEAFDLLLTIQKPKAKNTYAQAKCVVEGHLRPWFAEYYPNLDGIETGYEEIWAKFRATKAGAVTRRGKPLRLSHCRRYLVMALKRAQAKGWITKSFTKKDFALNEVHEPIGRALTPDEQTRLLRALDIHPKTKLQVQMARTMGMRLSEILKLRVDEVDLEKRVLNLDAARIKTRKPRKVPIPISNQVWPELNELVRSAKGLYVFPMDRNPDEAQADNRHWWALARRSSGVQCRFHDLRHTWASHMVAVGMPEDYIIKVGGFTREVMSKIYSHVDDKSLDRFRGAFDTKSSAKTDAKVRSIVGTLLKLVEISVGARAKEKMEQLL